ncbi:MAG: sigma-54-dependent Fis family transcriptional regulator [Calditrichaeota bacterium]|nr:MAG: sigma-54-dependent Fis family transcriptional regulator [Calditrichota bacterium]MBL1205501.1 sigma-54-dependent Fis family transcriptional regulator [Calditrichota bacterium]NOG45329.1 sigma-54-dependent Fis family transcriptional regulator [Calditrichota bacterium]
MNKDKILVIEDNAIWQRKYQKWLSQDYSFSFSSNIEDAKNTFNSFLPDIVLQDLGLPEIEFGLKMLDYIVSQGTDAKVIVITSSQDHQHALEAQKRGAYSYFFKSENIQDELPLLVKRAIRMQTLERDNRLLRDQLSAKLQFDNVIAVSKQMQGILKLVEQTKNTKEPVLLTGESGVGKEIIAKHIHARSLGKDKPFVAINSAAIPENLLENELFGHEQGAFTGAKNLKPGQFELAADGTLFLDEIGELPLSIQAKLLRVLQEKKFFRLGGSNEINANFRLIAATNRSLPEQISKREFREDLFYRLNVIPVLIPPLRERPDDIPALINYFIDRYCKTYNHKTKPKIENTLIRYLSKLEWKGNIRELENTLKRMLVVNSDTLSINDIPQDIQEQENPFLQNSLLNRYTMDDLTKMYAHLVYNHLNQNKKETCKFLNINYRTLVSRLEKP